MMNHKKKNRIRGFLIFVSLIFMGSCSTREDYPSFPSISYDPATNFEAFWVGINDNYIFFPYHDLNWDDVYAEFRPQINENTTENELVGIFKLMIDKLIDGHALIRANGVNYGKNDNSYRLKYQQVDTDQTVLNNYLETDTASNFYFFDVFNYEKDNNTLPEFYISRIKNSNIFYVKYYLFQNSLENSDQNEAFNNYLSQIQEVGFDGLILDLRNNGGGLASSFKNLISKFVPGDYTWGYSKFRLGRDRYQSTPFISETAQFKGKTVFTLPLVILTDRYSFSAAELTTLALKNLPNVTVIGDTTGGAEGPIFSAESEGGGLERDFTGNFKLPNGWIVQLAQKASFDNKKNIFEGKGIPPDLVEIPSQIKLNQGKDNVLDRAIDLLEK